MLLTNCENNLDLEWSKNCVIMATNVSANVTIFSIIDANVYVPVVTLATQDNTKQLKQLKSDFKTTIYWNKYQ